MSAQTGRGFYAVITGLLIVVLAISAYSVVRPVSTGVSPSDLSSLKSQVGGLQTQVGNLNVAVGKLYNASIFQQIRVIQGIPKPPAGMIAVQWTIGSVLRDTGLSFQVYTAAPTAKFWNTITLAPGQSCNYDWVIYATTGTQSAAICANQLLGQPLPNNTLFIEPGKSALVVFVVKSTASVNQTFAAVPHTYTPDTYSGVSLTTGVGEQCWCVAVQYPIAAGGTYIRVIGVSIDPAVPAGTQVALVHVLYGPPR